MKMFWFNIVLISWVASFSFSSFASENLQNTSNLSNSIVEHVEGIEFDSLDKDLDGCLSTEAPALSLIHHFLANRTHSAVLVASKDTLYIRGPPATTI